MCRAAGPAKTPEGYASGSFGPTTAGRMDSYVRSFMEKGGSFVTLAKGNRSREVRHMRDSSYGSDRWLIFGVGGGVGRENR
jgi:tartrate dehydratase beta subunit/fumarate hydratase class I family protein